jgi:hypothetical protein
MSRYAQMRHRQRLAEMPLPAKFWMRNDGLNHAQARLIESPRLVRTCVGIAAVVIVTFLFYFLWVGSTLYRDFLRK